jgi:hypothetical protein
VTVFGAQFPCGSFVFKSAEKAAVKFRDARNLLTPHERSDLLMKMIANQMEAGNTERAVSLCKDFARGDEVCTSAQFPSETKQDAGS